MARLWDWIYKRVPDQRWGGGVYALYQGAEVVYVGQSASLKNRIQAHIGRKRFEFDAVKVAPIQDSSERKFLERRLIQRLRPRHNGVVPVELNAVWWYRDRLKRSRNANPRP